jgi:hypothetical protein
MNKGSKVLKDGKVQVGALSVVGFMVTYGQFLTFSEQLRDIDLHVSRRERQVLEDTPEVYM